MKSVDSPSNPAVEGAGDGDRSEAVQEAVQQLVLHSGPKRQEALLDVAVEKGL